MPGGRWRRRTPRKEPLNNSVLKRMEGDDSKHTSRLQQTLGGKQRFCQLRQLVIDENPQGLEHPRCGMDFFTGLVPHHLLDQPHQVARGGKRLLCSLSLDGARNAACMTLLT